jgi:hypothetical protein
MLCIAFGRIVTAGLLSIVFLAIATPEVALVKACQFETSV